MQLLQRKQRMKKCKRTNIIQKNAEKFRICKE